MARVDINWWLYVSLVNWAVLLVLDDHVNAVDEATSPRGALIVRTDDRMLAALCVLLHVPEVPIALGLVALKRID